MPFFCSTGTVDGEQAHKVLVRALAWLLLSLVGFLLVASSATARPAYTLAANSKPVKGRAYTAVLPNGIALQLLWCPAGSFSMGSPKDELGRIEWEPLQEVRLSQGFWLGQFEVTQGQYLAVMGSNPSRFAGNDNRPVEKVSWSEAMTFCQRLNESLGPKLPAGYRFSLPTEAQWEYACRAGTSSALNSAECITSEKGSCANLNKLGWYAKNSAGSTHRVGQRLPNAWGFFDMHGNVYEWCRDWYGAYSGAATDPTGPRTGYSRAIRGGSWIHSAKECRSAARAGNGPDNRTHFLGFRLVLASAPAPAQ